MDKKTVSSFSIRGRSPLHRILARDKRSVFWGSFIADKSSRKVSIFGHIVWLIKWFYDFPMFVFEVLEKRYGKGISVVLIMTLIVVWHNNLFTRIGYQDIWGCLTYLFLCICAIIVAWRQMK